MTITVMQSILSFFNYDNDNHDYDDDDEVYIDNDVDGDNDYDLKGARLGSVGSPTCHLICWSGVRLCRVPQLQPISYLEH